MKNRTRIRALRRGISVQLQFAEARARAAVRRQQVRFGVRVRRAARQLAPEPTMAERRRVLGGLAPKVDYEARDRLMRRIHIHFEEAE